MAERKKKPKKKRQPITWRDKKLKDMTAREIKLAKDRLVEGWSAELPNHQLYAFTGLDEERVEELKKRDKELASVEQGYAHYLKTMSRLNVARKIVDKGDVPTSKWYLEHCDEDFKPSSKLDINGQPIIVPVEQKQEELTKLLEGFGGASVTDATGEQEE